MQKINFAQVGFEIVGIILIVAITLVLIFNTFFPSVKTVCLVRPFTEPQFDCSLIYAHLGEHMVLGAEYGSNSNIAETACSEQVRNLVSNATSYPMPKEGCHYNCCITDGTTSGVNQQAYSYD